MKKRINAGNFDWLDDKQRADMFRDIFIACDVTYGAWHYIQQYPVPSFLDDNDTNNLFVTIKNQCKLNQTKEAFLQNLQVMKEIASLNWDEWVKKNLKKPQEIVIVEV